VRIEPLTVPAENIFQRIERVEIFRVRQVGDDRGSASVRQAGEQRVVVRRGSGVEDSAFELELPATQSVRDELALNVLESILVQHLTLIGRQCRLVRVEKLVTADPRGSRYQFQGGPGDDSDLAQTGPYRIEQVRVLRCRAGQLPAVSDDDIELQNVVGLHSVQVRHAADTTDGKRAADGKFGERGEHRRREPPRECHVDDRAPPGTGVHPLRGAAARGTGQETGKITRPTGDGHPDRQAAA
jgi:hypothetical protein